MKRLRAGEEVAGSTSPLTKGIGLRGRERDRGFNKGRERNETEICKTVHLCGGTRTETLPQNLRSHDRLCDMQTPSEHQSTSFDCGRLSV